MTGCQPVFLIGAARSGTKLLRDTIASHPAVDRVPYDVNFIWRLGNETCPDDELEPAQASPAIAGRIRRKLASFGCGAPVLLEKTVSNSLRVPFLEAVFPDAKYIFLFRDGRDVVESAYRQWGLPADWKYLLKKAGSFPFLDAPAYALKFAAGLLQKPGGRAATWGPRYRGIDRDLAGKDLIEVCGIQWSRSVEKARTALDGLDRDRVLAIRYEDFVMRPDLHLAEIASYLGVDPGAYRGRLPHLAGISTSNIGKGWRVLSPLQRGLAGRVIQDQLIQLGYDGPLTFPFQADHGQLIFPFAAAD